MTDTAVITDPTIEALRQQMVRDFEPSQRTYLGGSVIGRDCERQLWQDFRWVLQGIPDADTIARFSDGHSSEEVIGKRLNAIPGLTLWTHNKDGKQFGYEAVGGHVRMHIDGVIKGLIQDQDNVYLWEAKCVNERKFRSLQKKKEAGESNALENWDGTYFAQAQLYMGVTKLTRHYLTVATPGSRDLMSCRTDFQPKVYEWLLKKAERVVFSPTPLAKISNKPDYYQCRWCTYSDNCHGEKVARVNCRTCAHVTPKADGTWHCDFHDNKLTIKKQRVGCSSHLLIPDLIPFGQVTGMNKEENKIAYQTEAGTKFSNAEKNDYSRYEFTSKDLQHLNADLLDRETDFFGLMSKFEGAHIESVRLKEKPEVVLEEPIPF